MEIYYIFASSSNPKGFLRHQPGQSYICLFYFFQITSNLFPIRLYKSGKLIQLLSRLLFKNGV